jgi:tetratricopeptide (TPR) repeat protein
VWRRILIGSLLAAAVVAVYAPVAGHPFLEFDDPLYVRDNAMVARGLTLDGVAWSVRTTEAFLWHPLTWLSLMLDAELFGTDRAGPFLISNVALHVASTLVLLAFLTSLTGRFWPSAFAAALFALHPLRVESVAWVSSRKDGLAGLFSLLAVWGYLGWVRRGGTRRYLTALGLYAAALLSKPTALTLPFLLLLIDAWPLGRVQRAIAVGGAAVRILLVEKLPWLGLALLAAGAHVWMSADTWSPWNVDVPLLQRMLAAPLHLAFHAFKSVWPADLSIVYPEPHQRGEPFHSGAMLAMGWAFAFALFAVAASAARRLPVVAWGVAWFVVALVPVMQLVPNGLRMPHDRYAWLPSIGPCVALAFVAAALWARTPGLRPWLAAAGAAVLVASGLTSAQQVHHWRSSEALFAHALAVEPRNVIVLSSRGVARARAGEMDAAIADFRAALAVHPSHAESHNSLGYLLSGRGEHAAGIAHLRAALAAQPGFTRAMSNLGNALDASGETAEALVWLQRATERAPDSAHAHYWLGLGLERRGEPRAALHYRRALELDPDHVWSRDALARLGGS